MSHDDETASATDRQLRQALRADPAAVERITRSALAAAAAPRRRFPAWLPASTLAAVALALALWPRWRPTDDEVPPSRPGPRITNHGEVVAVRDATGRFLLTRFSAADPGGEPRLIILKGDDDV